LYVIGLKQAYNNQIKKHQIWEFHLKGEVLPEKIRKQEELSRNHHLNKDM